MDEAQTRLVIFQDAGQAVEVRLDAGHDTVWLSQRQMAELFETTPENVLMHLKTSFVTPNWPRRQLLRIS